MKIDKKDFIDYTLLVLTVTVSGIPYFSNSALFVPLFAIMFSVFLLRKKRLDWNFVILLTFLVVITIVQTYIFSFYSIQTIIGVFLRVIIAYLIVKILEEKFIPYFINILYWMAIVSLLIYFSTLLVPAIGNMLINIVPIFDILNFANSDQPTIVIYNFDHVESFRNSGPFWEPGAFAGYLIIAYIFNFYSDDKYKIKKGIVLFVTTITTLSTTAYFALFVFLFFVYYKKIKNVFMRIMVVFIILLGGYYAFISFDFLGEKLEKQLEFAQKQGIEKSNDSQRFLNILRDIEDLKGYEIVGRGANPITRYSFGPLDQIRTVGLTDILVRMGLPFFLFMMYFLYRSICSYLTVQKQQNFFSCVGIFVTILMTLMSEVYFGYPMYWSLLLLQFVYKKPKEERF